MNQQTDPNIPDYSLFYRHINDASSPIHLDTEQNNASSLSPDVQPFETIVQAKSLSPPPPPPARARSKPKSNSSASTDDDVDELNLDYSDEIDRSTATMQAYLDQLQSRLTTDYPPLPPPAPFRARIMSMEYSQITADSGVDLASEQHKPAPATIDELLSEGTANQNDLFALSDDSLLDVESPRSNDVATRTVPSAAEKSLLSLTEGSDEGKTYLTAITNSARQAKAEPARANTSEIYYSAESEVNTSSASSSLAANNDLYSGYELENISDDEDTAQRSDVAEKSPADDDQFNFKLPSFSDWIDRVFTDFLAETKQEPVSSTCSLSTVSTHASHDTIDSSSSQILTIIEKRPARASKSSTSGLLDDTHQVTGAHRRSQSWPNDEQQDTHLMTSKSLSRSLD